MKKTYYIIAISIITNNARAFILQTNNSNNNNNGRNVNVKIIYTDPAIPTVTTNSFLKKNSYNTKSIHQSFQQRSQQQHQMKSRNNNNDDDEYQYDKSINTKEKNDDLIGKIIQPIESILLFLSTPIPNNDDSFSSSYSLPLVYPLTIIALNLVLDSLSTIVLLDVFFVMFFLFARTAISFDDDEEDEERYEKDGMIFQKSSNDDDGNGDDDDDDSLFQLDNKTLDLVALFGSVVSAALVSPAGLGFDTENIGIGNLIGIILLLICSSSGIIVNMKIWNDRDMNNGDRLNGIGRSGTSSTRGTDSATGDYAKKLISDWDEKFKEFDK